MDDEIKRDDFMIKKALFDKLEDEYDIADADKAYKEYVDSGNKSRPIEEFWKEQEIK